jgi:tetratricopeptide (TPR) repeat protein
MVEFHDMEKKKTLPAKREETRLQPLAPVKKLRFEIKADRIEDSVRQMVKRIQYWYRQGIIRKVRLKYRGKAILPDIPLSYFMLVQAASFFLAGIVRALAINVGARIFFEVEIVNDAEQQLKHAKELYLDGELDEAIETLEEVILLDEDCAEAYLYLGIIHKVKKDYETASRYFMRAQKLEPAGKSGVEAGKNLKKLSAPRTHN